MTLQAIFVTDPAELSARELQVLELIVNGRSNEQIAHELFLTVNTVKTYIRSAYRRIGVTTRPHAIMWGARHGLMAGVVPAGNDRHLESVPAA